MCFARRQNNVIMVRIPVRGASTPMRFWCESPESLSKTRVHQLRVDNSPGTRQTALYTRLLAAMLQKPLLAGAELCFTSKLKNLHEYLISGLFHTGTRICHGLCKMSRMLRGKFPERLLSFGMIECHSIIQSGVRER